jgi:hypothetical protein
MTNRQKLTVEEIFDEMGNGFNDKSGSSEVIYVGELIKDTISNEEYDKSTLDEGSLDMLDSSLSELIDAAEAARKYLKELRTEGKEIS